MLVLHSFEEMQFKKKRTSSKNELSNLFEMNPLIKKTFNRIDRIESEITFHLYSNKSKHLSCKTFDIERRMKKMKRRINHSSQEIQKHYKCCQDSQKENKELRSEHERKLNQGRYLGDVCDNIKEEIAQMKMKVLSLQQKKIKYDFLAFQYNEQIKYLKIDLNEISTKVIQMRKERNELLSQLKNQRNLIDKLIQG